METIPTISTSQISALCGVMVTINFLKELGINPAFETGNGLHWYEDDLPLIYMKMAEHFIRKATKETQKQLAAEQL